MDKNKNTLKSSPRILIFGAVTLTILIAVMLFTFFITNNISKKVQREDSKQIVSPTQIAKEPSVYLDLPENFPKDVPLVAKAKVTLANEENRQTTVVLLTALTVDEIHDFYVAQLPPNGWQITNQSQGGGLIIMYAEKENRQAIITIGKSDQGTTIALTLP